MACTPLKKVSREDRAEEGAGEWPAVGVDLVGGTAARRRDATLGEEGREEEVVLACAQHQQGLEAHVLITVGVRVGPGDIKEGQ
jgi:hypothetical protein